MKERFLKTYANLPIPIREDIVVVIDDEPISWRVCCIEVRADTKLGDKILTSLKEMKFI